MKLNSTIGAAVLAAASFTPVALAQIGADNGNTGTVATGINYNGDVLQIATRGDVNIATLGGKKGFIDGFNANAAAAIAEQTAGTTWLSNNLDMATFTPFATADAEAAAVDNFNNASGQPIIYSTSSVEILEKNDDGTAGVSFKNLQPIESLPSSLVFLNSGNLATDATPAATAVAEAEPAPALPVTNPSVMDGNFSGYVVVNPANPAEALIISDSNAFPIGTIPNFNAEKSADISQQSADAYVWKNNPDAITYVPALPEQIAGLRSTAANWINSGATIAEFNGNGTMNVELGGDSVTALVTNVKIVTGKQEPALAMLKLPVASNKVVVLNNSSTAPTMAHSSTETFPPIAVERPPAPVQVANTTPTVADAAFVVGELLANESVWSNDANGGKGGWVPRNTLDITDGETMTNPSKSFTANHRWSDELGGWITNAAFAQLYPNFQNTVATAQATNPAATLESLAAQIAALQAEVNRQKAIWGNAATKLEKVAKAGQPNAANTTPTPPTANSGNSVAGPFDLPPPQPAAQPPADAAPGTSAPAAGNHGNREIGESAAVVPVLPAFVAPNVTVPPAPEPEAKPATTEKPAAAAAPQGWSDTAMVLVGLAATAIGGFVGRFSLARRISRLEAIIEGNKPVAKPNKGTVVAAALTAMAGAGESAVAADIPSAAPTAPVSSPAPAPIPAGNNNSASGTIIGAGITSVAVVNGKMMATVDSAYYAALFQNKRTA